MNEAGVSRPARKIRKRKNEPGGVSVKPGTYKAELSYLELSSATMITVESDPRLDFSEKKINESYAAGKVLEKMTGTAADAVTQLVESKTTTEQFQKKLKKEDTEKYKDDLKAGKKLIKKIDVLIALYLGKDDKRQGITRNPEITVMQRIGIARRYSGSRPNGITSTEELLIQQAKDELNEALEKTNEFFVTDWAEYRSKMEEMELSPFKEIKSFKTN